MLNPHWQELAYRQTFEQLSESEEAELWAAAQQEPELLELLRGYQELNENLAQAVPQTAPLPHLKAAVLDHLESEVPPEVPRQSTPAAKIIWVNFWLPYAAAAALLVWSLYEYSQVDGLRSEISHLQVSLTESRQQNALEEVRLTELKAQDQSFNGAQVLLAWDARENRGILYLKNLPSPPPGRDYQLWLLPAKGSPASAGLVVDVEGDREFQLGKSEISRLNLTPGDHPGFAVSIEPTGGSPAPTGPVVLLTTGL